jgi:hypothetical protein
MILDTVVKEIFHFCTKTILEKCIIKDLKSSKIYL